MKETDISRAPIKEQLEFWKGFVEGMSLALYEARKAYRLKCKDHSDLEQNILFVKSGNVSLDDLVLDIEHKRKAIKQEVNS